MQKPRRSWFLVSIQETILLLQEGKSDTHVKGLLPSPLTFLAHPWSLKLPVSDPGIGISLPPKQHHQWCYCSSHCPKCLCGHAYLRSDLPHPHPLVPHSMASEKGDESRKQMPGANFLLCCWGWPRFKQGILKRNDMWTWVSGKENPYSSMIKMSLRPKLQLIHKELTFASKTFFLDKELKHFLVVVSKNLV